MLQSSLKVEGEEEEEERKINITITIGFCKNFCKNLIISINNNSMSAFSHI
jgi:hypothetical protein